MQDILEYSGVLRGQDYDDYQNRTLYKKAELAENVFLQLYTV